MKDAAPTHPRLLSRPLLALALAVLAFTPSFLLLANPQEIGFSLQRGFPAGFRVSLAVLVLATAVGFHLLLGPAQDRTRSRGVRVLAWLVLALACMTGLLCVGKYFYSSLLRDYAYFLPARPEFNPLEAGFAVALLALCGYFAVLRRRWRMVAELLVAVWAFVCLWNFAARTFRPVLRPVPVPAPAAAPAPRRSVYLMVFDELDHMDLAGQLGGEGLRTLLDQEDLPYLEYRNCLPPGNATILSIPSFLIGEKVVKCKFTARRGVLWQTPGGKFLPPEAYRERMVFTRLAERGVPSTVAGWYLPYRQLFPGLSDHQMPAMGPNNWLFEPGFDPRLHLYLLRAQFPFSKGFANKVNAAAHREFWTAIQADALDRAARHEPGFHFYHINVPHLPAVAQGGLQPADFLFPNRGLLADYRSNLSLLPPFLHAFLRELKAGGADRPFTVILTSDHFFRTSTGAPRFDPRIPMLIIRSDGTGRTLVDTQVAGERIIAETLDQAFPPRP